MSHYSLQVQLGWLEYDSWKPHWHRLLQALLSIWTSRPIEQHSRIRRESPAVMTLNVACELLGPLYELYVAALGDTAAWVLGHLTLLAIVVMVAWLLKNRNEVITGLDLRPRTIGGIIIIIGLFIGTTLIFTRSLGFPLVGSLLTSFSSVAFVFWCYRWLEPARV